jgi:hypothetical protein
MKRLIEDLEPGERRIMSHSIVTQKKQVRSPEVLAPIIHKALQDGDSAGYPFYLKAGEMLLEARKTLKADREYGDWCGKEFPDYSRQTLYRFQDLAKRAGDALASHRNSENIEESPKVDWGHTSRKSVADLRNPDPMPDTDWNKDEDEVQAEYEAGEDLGIRGVVTPEEAEEQRLAHVRKLQERRIVWHKIVDIGFQMLVADKAEPKIAKYRDELIDLIDSTK